jgi:hypothetical protein
VLDGLPPRLPHMPRLAAVTLGLGWPKAQLYGSHIARMSQLAHLDVSAPEMRMADLAGHLASLPALESLVARHHGAWAGSLVRAGVRLPHLTRLVMREKHREAVDQRNHVVAVLAQLAGLQHLELKWGYTSRGYVRALAPALAALARLRHLCLTCEVWTEEVPGSSAADLWSALSSLGLLTVLKFDICDERAFDCGRSALIPWSWYKTNVSAP